MIRELWVAGFPSRYGGADTELDHQIDLLRECGVAVHLVPMFGADPAMKESVLARGCQVHAYRDDVFAGRVVASWCNGAFLEHLPRIMYAGPPRSVIWFNCMTWTFPRELEAHDRGWIDVFGFVSDYQRSLLEPALAKVRPVRSFRYRPHFDVHRVSWRYRPFDGTHRVGRISRDDAAKFALDTWQLFDEVRVPAGVKKEVWVLGFGPNARRRLGPPPEGLRCRLWAPCEVPVATFYAGLDTLVHKTGGSRESYGRCLVEAYAYGVAPVVERAYAFEELVVHGETGFLASDREEMVEHASALAHDPALHRRIVEGGRRHLEERLVDPDASWAGWDSVLR